MPLYVEVSVNSQQIIELKITRLDRTPLAEVSPDDIFEYQVSYVQDEDIDGVSNWEKIFKLSHRYGDGAASLCAKALFGLHQWTTTAMTVTTTEDESNNPENEEHNE